jgi:hypothetical protein
MRPGKHAKIFLKLCPHIDDAVDQPTSCLRVHCLYIYNIDSSRRSNDVVSSRTLPLQHRFISSIDGVEYVWTQINHRIVLLNTYSAKRSTVYFLDTKDGL